MAHRREGRLQGALLNDLLAAVHVHVHVTNDPTAVVDLAVPVVGLGHLGDHLGDDVLAVGAQVAEVDLDPAGLDLFEGDLVATLLTLVLRVEPLALVGAEARPEGGREVRQGRGAFPLGALLTALDLLLDRAGVLAGDVLGLPDGDLQEHGLREVAEVFGRDGLPGEFQVHLVLTRELDPAVGQGLGGGGGVHGVLLVVVPDVAEAARVVGADVVAVVVEQLVSGLGRAVLAHLFLGQGLHARCLEERDVFLVGDLADGVSNLDGPHGTLLGHGLNWP